jgi:hypothetical protein
MMNRLITAFSFTSFLYCAEVDFHVTLPPFYTLHRPKPIKALTDAQIDEAEIKRNIEFMELWNKACYNYAMKLHNRGMHKQALYYGRKLIDGKEKSQVGDKRQLC